MTEAVYINLDRAPERARHMQDALGRAGFQCIRRLPAIDARIQAESPRYLPRQWGAYWTMKPSEIACFESHRAAWQSLADGPEEAMAIFEDDVVMTDGLGAAVAALGACSEAFDVIKLDTAPGQFRLGAQHLIAGLAVRPILQVMPSAAAYVLSRQGAGRLLTMTEQYCDHLDDFVMRPFPGWRPFQLCPALAAQAMFLAEPPASLPASVVQSVRTADTATNAGYDKGPIPYRLWKEARRAWRKASRKLVTDGRLRAEGGFIGPVPHAEELGRLRPTA